MENTLSTLYKFTFLDKVDGQSLIVKDSFNPIRTGGLKKSSYNPYLKFLDFSQLLVADTPMKFFFRKILFAPADSTFETRSTKIFFCFLL